MCESDSLSLMTTLESLVPGVVVDTVSKTAALLDAEIVDLYMLELEDLPILEFVVTVTLSSVAGFVGSIVDTVGGLVALYPDIGNVDFL